MKLKIFTMGGTIDKIYFDDMSDYEVGAPQVTAILAEAQVDLDFELEEIVRKDSLLLTDNDRELLKQKVAADSNSHILITHGTDGMTASASLLMGIPDKVIVFTGAMSPYRFRSSDAAFNVGCAIGALQALQPGVYLAMSGQIFTAGTVKKNREAGRFEKHQVN